MPDTCPCRRMAREMREAAARYIRDEAPLVDVMLSRERAVVGVEALPIPDCICSPGVVAAARKLASLSAMTAPVLEYRGANEALIRAVKEAPDA